MYRVHMPLPAGVFAVTCSITNKTVFVEATTIERAIHVAESIGGIQKVGEIVRNIAVIKTKE